MTTAKSIELMAQRNDTRLDMRVPAKIKSLVVKMAKKKNIDIATWVKLAIVEKAEREDIQS